MILSKIIVIKKKRIKEQEKLELFSFQRRALNLGDEKKVTGKKVTEVKSRKKVTGKKVTGKKSQKIIDYKNIHIICKYVIVGYNFHV